MRNRKNFSIIHSVTISLLLHLGLFAFLAVRNDTKKQVKKPVKIVTNFVPIKLPDKEKDIVKQKKFNEQKPKNPSVYSEKDNTVEKETVNKGLGDSPSVGASPSQSKPNAQDLPDNGGLAIGPKKLDLFPSGIGQGITPGAGLGDSSPGAEEGGETLLNSEAYKYSSFFTRVKECIVSHWRPVEPYQREDPDHKKYGIKDRITLLGIVLDATGTIEEVNILSSSGVDLLDSLAIESFRSCFQFPNPPSGIIVDGRIRFRFSFTVLIGSAKVRF